ncbi:primosomal replication protein PriB/PriC domain protein [Pseudoxanthomonas winnipegensis]|uniref:primosomal replication protein PriB/PriC domain protein n=1 Tax=Pseudoxanthomonas winnipegensis TaxID=2480810 RepID=UPI00102DA5F8|nr:primosomal replication protein PriB/PriC domain protein [Pseudoxanthomonas winnipegensis]RZZ81951.1 primosomal replication protein PriB/PriC domain protein [Pseudoxanthomonas winnipegensis]TAA42183.1 primosomal replication protein PriB/PriC domain protein [Pseudoxanthomonas winnipegensis]
MATALDMVTLYTNAEQKVLSGQRVRFGDRELTYANLPEIRAGRQEWERRAALEASASRPGCATADFGGVT